MKEFDCRPEYLEFLDRLKDTGNSGSFSLSILLREEFPRLKRFQAKLAVAHWKNLHRTEKDGSDKI